MRQRCEVTGIFTIEVDAKNTRDAEQRATRILRDSGITGHVINVKKKREDENC